MQLRNPTDQEEPQILCICLKFMIQIQERQREDHHSNRMTRFRLKCSVYVLLKLITADTLQIMYIRLMDQSRSQNNLSKNGSYDRLMPIF
jgi:hypothetical protein